METLDCNQSSEPRDSEGVHTFESNMDSKVELLKNGHILKTWGKSSRTKLINEKIEVETDAYRRLKDVNFIPKCYGINDKSIEIEYITAPNLYEYIEDNKRVPYGFATALYTIEKTLAEHMIPDIELKGEHIFCDQRDRSPETFGVRIIDFDADKMIADNEARKRVCDGRLKQIEEKYAFLFRDDQNSLEAFAASFDPDVAKAFISDFKSNGK